MGRVLSPFGNDEITVFQSSELIYMVGMIVLSISVMSMLIFGCTGHASGRPRDKRGRTGGAGGAVYGDGDGGGDGGDGGGYGG
ncbi:hypothetical protein ACS0TY_017479 [Phlomoides rotata]